MKFILFKKKKKKLEIRNNWNNQNYFPATQRIIELSKPKRKRKLKITKINHNKRKSKLYKEKSR